MARTTKTTTKRGVLFGARPSTDIALAAASAHATPGPGAYLRRAPGAAKVVGGKFSESRPPSAIEAAMRRAAAAGQADVTVALASSPLLPRRATLA